MYKQSESDISVCYTINRADIRRSCRWYTIRREVMTVIMQALSSNWYYCRNVSSKSSKFAGNISAVSLIPIRSCLKVSTTGSTDLKASVFVLPFVTGILIFLRWPFRGIVPDKAT